MVGMNIVKKFQIKFHVNISGYTVYSLWVYYLSLLLLLIALQYNRISEEWWTEDFWSTDGLPATCVYSL